MAHAHTSQAADNKALVAPPIITSPGSAYATHNRLWQGIPGIERACNGRLWATWYSGGSGEGPDNHVLLYSSGDDGQRWDGPLLVIDPPGTVRAFDPCLWHDPNGRLWLFWAQSDGLYDGRAGVWCIVSDDATTADARWSRPRRIAHGVMMNKPVILNTGEWLALTAIWAYRPPYRPELAAERFSNVIRSIDQGRTWSLLGGADVPDRQFDEHMLVERRDGTLWMLVRTSFGIGESTSHDRGATWSPGKPTDLGGPGSRFHLRRMASGRLLLVNHVLCTGRNNLAAMLSDDDGRTWSQPFMIDPRDRVSYPDAVEAEDGRIHLIYDRERSGAKEILMAVFSERDVTEGRLVSTGSRLRVLVNGAMPAEGASGTASG
jgi:predicted neuraminidase